MKLFGEGYDWKKTAIKFITMFAFGGVGYLITYFANLPQQGAIIVAITAVLTSVWNMLKHRMDE